MKEFEATPHALIIITSIAEGRAIFFLLLAYATLPSSFFQGSFEKKVKARKRNKPNKYNGNLKTKTQRSVFYRASRLFLVCDLRFEV